MKCQQHKLSTLWQSKTLDREKGAAQRTATSPKKILSTRRARQKKRSQQYLMVQYLERNSMHSLIEIYYTNAFDSVLKLTQSSERALCDRCSKSAATQ